MEWILDSQIWLSLVTLTLLEIVLGIDNIIFIAILVGKLPKEKQTKGRFIGLGLAMLTRIALLFSITLIMRLTQPIITIFSRGLSGRDIILILGGLFLLGKSTLEIHGNLEGDEHGSQHGSVPSKVSFLSVIIQIMLLDIVFSLDSVITAIGLADKLWVMILAIIIAVIFMMFLAGKINNFIQNHPTIKILALSFLLLIGISLFGEGFGMHIPKGYIYFAMAFSVFVEMLNLKIRKQPQKPVTLRKSYSK